MDCESDVEGATLRTKQKRRAVWHRSRRGCSSCEARRVPAKSSPLMETAPTQSSANVWFSFSPKPGGGGTWLKWGPGFQEILRRTKRGSTTGEWMWHVHYSDAAEADGTPGGSLAFERLINLIKIQKIAVRHFSSRSSLQGSKELDSLLAARVINLKHN